MLQKFSYLRIAKLISVVTFFFLNSAAFSQLHITANNNAIQLAQTILGTGVTISNATLNCGSSAAGTFSYAGTNIGIPSGIILTTGYAPGAANPGSYFCNVMNGNSFSDPDLIAINTRANYDVCILNFDFVPICDTVRINYIFGSEEYPQYLHQMYNDLFGIFLTGAKPGGGNYNAKNIATLPNGFTPVSIDSINEGWPTTSNASHMEYYHDNHSNPNNDIAYDGYTIPITSKAALVPCSQYHMKIAIADGGNGHNDSGVLIKGGSLGCMNVPSVTSTTVFSCVDKGKIKINISNYAGTPSFTWIPGGLHTDSLNNIAPGTYTCYVNLPGICNNFTTVATVPEFTSLDVPTKSVSICKGQSTQLNTTGAITYTWLPATGLNNTSVASPLASPSVSTIYTVIAKSASGCLTIQTLTVHVSSNALHANFGASTYEATIDDPTIKFTDLSSGATNWFWDFDEAGSGSALKNPEHTFNTPGTYLVHLAVTDADNCVDTISKNIIIYDIIKDLFTFYAPNSFTPNGDGLNDTFLPFGVGWDITSYSMEIFDRWGKKLFSTTDHAQGWNGFIRGAAEPAPIGIYIYKIELKDLFNKTHSYSGFISVIN